tara:strand:+ start:689 stop:1108 length:420 start_codon:yes stop_codon:yes gene_type:complete
MIEYSGINKIERLRQALVFEGMQFGPSKKMKHGDIDGFIDFKGEFFVFVENKLMGNDLNIGQRLGLEHIVKAIDSGIAKAIAFVVNHNVKECEEPVMLKDCEVIEYYYNGKWQNVKSKIKYKDAINLIAEKQGIKTWVE